MGMPGEIRKKKDFDDPILKDVLTLKFKEVIFRDEAAKAELKRLND